LKIELKIEDAVEPVMQEAKELKKTIKEKRFVTLKNKVRWFQFWRRGEK